MELKDILKSVLGVIALVAMALVFFTAISPHETRTTGAGIQQAIIYGANQTANVTINGGTTTIAIVQLLNPLGYANRLLSTPNCVIDLYHATMCLRITPIYNYTMNASNKVQAGVIQNLQNNSNFEDVRYWGTWQENITVFTANGTIDSRNGTTTTFNSSIQTINKSGWQILDTSNFTMVAGNTYDFALNFNRSNPFETADLLPSFSQLNFTAWAVWNTSGGSQTYDGLYTVVTFTSNGTLVVTGNITNASVLLVAGGGGGAGQYNAGGGAGAGGLNYTTMNLSGNLTVIIGLGGNGTSGNNIGFSGGNTVFNGVTTIGGGGGGTGQKIAGNGGSGGGGGGIDCGSAAAGNGTAGQGGNGYTGACTGSYGVGGGGGGASGNAVSRWGANGTNYTITGTNTYYAGGGGGGIDNRGTTTPAGAGGLGGGGNGTKGGAGGNAINGTGGGGGGGGYAPGDPGGRGGNGIVVIRYLTFSSITFIVNSTAGGSATGNNTAADPPSNLTINATPTTGFYFFNWTTNCIGSKIGNSTNPNTIIEVEDAVPCFAQANFVINPIITIRTGILSYNGTVVNYNFSLTAVSTVSITNCNLSIYSNGSMINSTLANLTAGTAYYNLITAYIGNRGMTDQNFTATARIQATNLNTNDSVIMILPIDPPSAINLMSNGGKDRCRTPQDIGYWDGRNWSINATWGCNYTSQALTTQFPTNGIVFVGDGTTSFSNSNILTKWFKRLDGDTGTNAIFIFQNNSNIWIK